MNTSKLPIHIRIKELRKENSLTQEELASKMELDNKMISFYENGKSVPSVDALIRMAKIFNVSVDYLLFEEAPKKPLMQEGNKEIIELLSSVDKFSNEDIQSIIHILKSLVTKNQIKDYMTKVS
jgi:transcriptional regulator with XRE-family HTH domain